MHLPPFSRAGMVVLMLSLCSLGIGGVGLGAMGLSFFLCFIQAVVAVKFGTQLEYDAIMSSGT